MKTYTEDREMRYEWQLDKGGWNKYLVFPNGNAHCVTSGCVHFNLPLRWVAHVMRTQRTGTAMRYW